MFKIDHITGKNTHRIHNFYFEQKLGTTHVLLCPSVNFLNEFQNVLLKKEPLKQGSITLHGKTFTSKALKRQCHFITNQNMLYPELSVIENVFMYRNFSNTKGKKCKKEFDELLNQTGFKIRADEKVKNLTIEAQKIVEILRSYYAKPKLLIVREINGVISFNTFMRFIDALKVMNKAGTTCLYLTNQWEEAVKVSGDITVVINGENQGTYSAEEVRKNPSELCYLSLGAKEYLENKEEKEIENKERVLNLSIKKGANGYNIRNTVQMYAQYLLKELQATTAVTYLVDSRKNRLIDIVSHNSDSEIHEEPGIAPCLKNEVIQRLLEQKGFGYFSKDELFFSSSFIEDPYVHTVICYSFEINDDLSVLMQINYQSGHVHSERDMLTIEWAAREMAIFIENSHLMGKSVLLQESYHRIKNNLQIIISLMEMQKESAFAKFINNDTGAELIAVFDSAIGRVECISKIHELLAHDKVRNNFCDVQTIILSVCEFYENSVNLNLSFDSIFIPYSKAVSIALVANEIISNSIKHNRLDQGPLRIDFSVKKSDDNETVIMICHDYGKGFPCGEGENFDVQSDGVGITVIESIVNLELDGEIRMYNENGAVVRIQLPMGALLPIEKREVEFM